MAPFVDVSASRISQKAQIEVVSIRFTVKQVRPSDESIDRAHVDDRRTARHVGDRSLAHVEHLSSGPSAQLRRAC